MKIPWWLNPWKAYREQRLTASAALGETARLNYDLARALDSLDAERRATANVQAALLIERDTRKRIDAIRQFRKRFLQSLIRDVGVAPSVSKRIEDHLLTKTEDIPGARPSDAVIGQVTVMGLPPPTETLEP